jgi:cytochrome c2
MASGADLERIQADLTRLGWDQARLEAFLRSPKSPTRGRTAIRTLADANKVHWALKHLSPRKEQLAAS